MIAINLLKLAAAPILALTLSGAQAASIEPRMIHDGNCREIIDRRKSFAHDYISNYLESDGQKTIWNNKRGFHAEWNYQQGTVELTAGQYISEINVMSVAWLQDQNETPWSDVWKYYGVLPGHTCTAHVGQIPASNAYQKVSTLDTAQY